MSASLHSQSTEPCAKNTAAAPAVRSATEHHLWADTTPGQILNWGARSPVDASQA